MDMSGYHLSAPTAADVEALAPHVREEERLELQHTLGVTAKSYLMMTLKGDGFGGSLVCLRHRNEALGMGGVRSHPNAPEIGIPWFIGRDLTAHRRFMVDGARNMLRDACGGFSVLFNIVGAWNRQSIAWLRHMGFTVGKTTIPIGLARAPFYPFRAERSVFDV